MKLIMERAQAEEKGVFGGYKGMVFHLSCSAKLTQEEQKLVSKYRLERHVLTHRTIGDNTVPDLHLDELLEGRSYDSKDVVALLEREEAIMNACKQFKTLMAAMTSYEGEEITEF